MGSSSFQPLLLEWNVYTLWDGDLANDDINFQVLSLFLIRFKQVSPVCRISYDMLSYRTYMLSGCFGSSISTN